MTIAIPCHAYRLISGSKGLIVEFVNSVDLSEFAWPNYARAHAGDHLNSAAVGATAPHFLSTSDGHQ
jgi:hypothetical protein